MCADVQTISGWVCDGDDYSLPVKLVFFLDSVGNYTWPNYSSSSQYLGEVTADQNGGNVCLTNCGNYANHAYLFNIPVSRIRDGQDHNIIVYALNVNTGGGSTGSVISTLQCDGITPTPTPFAPVCLNITPSKTSPQLNDQVTFTCGQITGATSYQFRYRINTGNPISLATSSLGSNVSTPLIISQAGDYQVQCQACNSAGCSGYESW
jgi:hypothetical protein